MCRSSRCQPRGRTTIVASRTSSRSAYSLPSAELNASVRRTASCRHSCPPTTLSQCGVFASSRSASHTLASELSALIAILRSTGPVISTRRSTRSAGAVATDQSPARTSAVSARKSSRPVRAISSRRWSAAASSSERRAPKRRCRSATNSIASAVSTSSARSRPEACTWVVESTPATLPRFGRGEHTAGNSGALGGS